MRACYWPRANSWGAAGAITLGALIPFAYLVFEAIPATSEAAKNVGAERAGIAAFIGAGLAMVIGSYLKPSSSVRTAS